MSRSVPTLRASDQRVIRMSLQQSSISVPSSVEAPSESPLSVRLATSAPEVIAAQRLRYKVFCEEMGADLHRHDGRDVDDFDAVCDHLIVIDESLGKVVGGTYRIMAPWAHARSSACIRKASSASTACDRSRMKFSRSGAPASTLPTVAAVRWRDCGRSWHVCTQPRCEVPRRLRQRAAGQRCPQRRRTAQRIAGQASRTGRLPRRADSWLCSRSAIRWARARRATTAQRGYLRLGAWVCGEPAWDPDFDSADFFVLLPIERMAPRYAQHFLGARTAQ